MDHPALTGDRQRGQVAASVDGVAHEHADDRHDLGVVEVEAMVLHPGLVRSQRVIVIYGGFRVWLWIETVRHRVSSGRYNDAIRTHVLRVRSL
jgi:hypothetical protein